MTDQKIIIKHKTFCHQGVTMVSNLLASNLYLVPMKTFFNYQYLQNSNIYELNANFIRMVRLCFSVIRQALQYPCLFPCHKFQGFLTLFLQLPSAASIVVQHFLHCASSQSPREPNDPN